MATAVNVLVIFFAVLIVGVVLLQVRGTGATLFGAAESSFRVRRGFEKLLFRATIVLSLLFAALAVWHVRLQG
ncbi:MAG: preprotein translocase subunit SecG [Chloroflexi bacterium]|nr:preprotein translocase subunit SecG [Chloroflexota bacterium]